jgi:Ca2+-binding RTX toxin-like protein
MAAIRGTAGKDTLRGTEADDKIDGLAGNDDINGFGGNDEIYGGAGNDTIEGSTGKDTLYGGDGNDTIIGPEGDDVMYGDRGGDTLIGGFAGKNTMYGGLGNDTLNGDADDDKLYGNEGNDKLDGGDDNDRLNGNEGNDLLDGGFGNDTLKGDRDNDTLIGNFGNDTLSGGAGNDFLFGLRNFDDPSYIILSQIDTLTGGEGRDTFAVTYTYDDRNSTTPGTNDYVLITDFQPNRDFIQLAGAKSNYLLSASPNGLPQGTAIFLDKPGSQPDELLGIVRGVNNLDLSASYFITTNNETFVGTDTDDKFDAGSGNDFLTGDRGNDILSGGDGNDTLRGIAGVLQSPFTPADDSIGQIDTLTGGAGRDKFILGGVVAIPPNITPSRFAAAGPFYDDRNNSTVGTSDYALITDFQPTEDTIQLRGVASDYILAASPNGSPAGTGLFINKPNTEPDELIAVLQGVNPSTPSLTDTYFSYV